METLEQADSASNSTKREFNLLRERDRHEDWRHWRVDAAVSAGLHLALVLVLWFAPSPSAPPPEPEHVFYRVTPIFVPRDLTQKAPNKAPISKMLRVESIAPRPAVKSPSPAPALPRSPQQQARTFVPPAPETPQAEPRPEIAEPPKVDISAPLTTAQISQLAPPPPPAPVEQPKLTLQEVAPPPGTRSQGTARGSGLLAVPSPSVENAIKNLAHNGADGGQRIGDVGTADGAGMNLPASPGQSKSALELKSDAMGVDFRPYLIQVLAAVRRNWFAVYPEAARRGQRGQVVLQFAIVKQGTVAKIVFDGQSGAKALDEAAVAAVSASNPLPPLPAEFRGDRIVLAMTFQYNMPR
jgi:TonB family protein